MIPQPITRRPAACDWYVTVGDTAELTIAFQDEAEAPLNLSGRTFEAGVDTFAGGARVGQIVVDASNAATGLLLLLLDDAVSKRIPEGATWWLREVVSGEPRTLLDGAMPAARPGAAGISGDAANALTVQIVNNSVVVITTAVTGPAGSGGGGGGGSMTPPEILAALVTVDGAGSGLDADTVDGAHAADLATTSALAAHEADTTGIHGIADTASLVVTTDGRLSNARTPTAHASTHAAAGSDPIAITAAQVTSGTLDIARIPAAVATDAEVTAAIAALSTVYQPLDSDLTAIAALTTTAFGRSLLTLADAAVGRSVLGLGTAATQASTAFDAAGAAAAAQAASQPLDSDLTAIAALTTTTFGRAVLALADATAARTHLGLGGLATLSAVTSAEITDGTIVDADINAAAAIAATKIAGLATIATSGSATDLASGTVPTARLGSGTANSTTVLRGDQTWGAAPGGGAARAWVPYGSTLLTGPGAAITGEQNVPAAFANHLVLGVLVVDRAVTITGFRCNVATTGTATAAQLAMWRCDENGTSLEACTWTISSQGNIAVTSTGWKQVSLGSSVSITAGIYAVGFVANGTVTLAANRHISGLPDRRDTVTYQFVSGIQHTSFTYGTSLGDITSGITQLTNSGSGYEILPVYPQFTL